MTQRIRPYAVTDVPDALDGSHGDNRAPVERLQVPLANDREAIGYFLEQYAASEGTHRLYARECERLALWALHVRGKAVSSLNVTDIEQYIEFLAQPAPAQDWCGPKAPRDSDAWRPFVGPIDVKARLAALSAVNSMLNYWVQAGYINGNPLGLFRQLKQKILSGATSSTPTTGKKRRTPKAAVVVEEDARKVDRYLDDEMWQAAMDAVEDMATQESANAQGEYERARFVMAFLYLMAPRVGELETHAMNSFREEHGRWWWYVTGKGSKLGKVPVPDDMLQALVRYRRHLGLTAVPGPRDDSPLLRSIRHPGEPITARRLNQVLKDIFKAAAQRLPETSSHKAEKLLKASAHWGRHTSISAKVTAGVDHLHVQRDARHADFRTTQLYIHDADDARHDAAQKLRLEWKTDTNEGSDQPQ